MDVTAERFAKDVLEASELQPIVVDFWAPWCGPCRLIGPVLEKLERETGRFTLAKINTDEEPELAQLWAIRSIPAVKLFRNGRVAAEFMGAIPESAIRRWLDENIPDESRMRLDAAKAALAEGKRDDAQKLLESVVQHSPDLAEARVLLAEILLPKEPDRARQLVDAARDDGSLTDRIEGVQWLTELLTRSLDGNGSDAADRYKEGILAWRRGDARAALEAWLDVVRRDRSLDDDGARRAVIALFHWLGDHHPVTTEMRPRLASAMF
jgi:putative thioredoxin